MKQFKKFLKHLHTLNLLPLQNIIIYGKKTKPKLKLNWNGNRMNSINCIPQKNNSSCRVAATREENHFAWVDFCVYSCVWENDSRGDLNYGLANSVRMPGAFTHVHRIMPSEMMRHANVLIALCKALTNHKISTTRCLFYLNRLINRSMILMEWLSR